jgi:hypothetical protein
VDGSQTLDLTLPGQSSRRGSLARIFPWQAVAAAWAVHVRGCGGRLPGSWVSSLPAGLLRRTSLASCQPAVPAPVTVSVGIAVSLFDAPGNFTPSPAAPVGGSASPVMGGQWVPSSGVWAMSGMGSRTECWTLSSSECPSGGGVSSSLADILQPAGTPGLSRYFLGGADGAGVYSTGGGGFGDYSTGDQLGRPLMASDGRRPESHVVVSALTANMAGGAGEWTTTPPRRVT